MVQLLIRTCINRVETNMPFTYQTFYEKVQTYSMKRASTCGVHSYHVNGYFLQNLLTLNLLQHFLMCAMVFENMVSETFETMFLQKWFLRKCGNTILSVSSLDTSTPHIILISHI
jgi:hypothetical protein